MCSWLVENMPYYYSLTVEALGPLLETTLEKVKVAGIFILQRISEIILWVQENTPLLIEWVSNSWCIMNVNLGF